MTLLRPYQRQAVDEIKKDFTVQGNSLIVVPTAGGKSWIIAVAVAELNVPTLILVPSRELLTQNMEKLVAIIGDKDVGVYSASFNRKEVKKITFATIQSVYKKPELFQHIGLVFIDEAHFVQLRSLDSMYGTFLKGIGSPKVIGLTATCFRLEIGYFRHPNGDLEAATMLKILTRMRHKSQTEMFWKRILFHISHAELLAQGYLCPLQYVHSPLLPYEEIPVNQSHSDYNLEAYTQAIVGREAQILSTISEAQKRFKSILVFCSTTEQARTLQATVKHSEMVFADTKPKDRQRIVEDFKSGKVQTVFNVACLTTGFDHPDMDCLILLRPTRSLPLYNQIIGRITRLAPNKRVGTVIDLTGTCKALGRIESFQLYRNERGLWNLRTEKHEGWHDRVLFTRII